jgi:hypothetical protein
VKRAAKRLLAAFALVSLIGSAGARALDNRSSCFQDYTWCMFDASLLDGFWRRAAAGADCTVDLARCIRDAILN